MGTKIRTGATLVKNALETVILSATRRLPRLRGMVFEVTDACNSRCRYCKIWNSRHTKDTLTLAEIERTFGDPLVKDLEYIILTGGEPALRRDLKEIIFTLSRLVPKARITLSTNGLLPWRVVDLVRSALEAGICLTVGVSLDGVGKNHDYIRGVPGNFNKVDYLLRELTELKACSGGRLSLLAGHTLSDLTADSLREAGEYAGRLKLDAFFTQLREEFSYYDNAETRLNPGNGRMIDAVSRMPGSLHNSILLMHLRRNRPVKFRCSSMKSFFLLRCNGDVSPCLRHARRSAGNVRSAALSAVWRGWGAKETREVVKGCSGCSSTWGTSWSLDAWFPPFAGVIAHHLVHGRFGRAGSYPASGVK